MRVRTAIATAVCALHNDPAGAYPHNVFFKYLVAFLSAV
jgi:hypothetical protein